MHPNMSHKPQPANAVIYARVAERRNQKSARNGLTDATALLNEKLGAKSKPRQRPSQEFEPALGFLKNPMNLWRSDDLARKQATMKMLFAERLGYKKKIGVRTPIYTCPVNALTAIAGGKSEMARPKGFEPLTPRFVVWCSIQLSYGRPRTSVVAGAVSRVRT